MNDTPSGNRWEPADDDTAPVNRARTETLPPAIPSAAPVPPTTSRTRRRRAALLASGAALALAAGTGGYALSSVGAGAGDDLGSHQAPDDSVAGHGFPEADGDGDHAAHPDADGDEDHVGPDGDD